MSLYTCYLCGCELDTPQQLANHLGRLHGIDQPNPNAPTRKVTTMRFASTGRLVDYTSGLEILWRDHAEALNVASQYGGRPRRIDGGYVIDGPPPLRINANALPPGWEWVRVGPKSDRAK